MKILKSIAVRNASGRAVEIHDLSPERVRAAVYRILEENVLCSLATVSPSDRAHINTAYFAYTDDFQICFMSHPNSRHCQNVRTNPTMAVSIYSSAQNWSGPDRGVQLFGACRQASVSEPANAAEAYARRFTTYRTWAASLGAGDAAREYRFFWFMAQEIKLLDEGEFGDGVFVSAAIS